MKAEYHRPALLQETVDLLSVRPDGTYVDVTFGGGGHSAEILRRLGPNGKLFAFDKDPDAQQNLLQDPRFQLIDQDFRFIEKALNSKGITQVDGILGDLGVSSHQFDEGSRGFSFRFDARLDMRMDPSAAFDAVDLLNSYSEADLRQILKEWGDVQQAGKIAAAIVTARKNRRIETTGDMERVVGSVIAAQNLTKILTLVYQAIRIEVNGELDALEALLESGLRLLRPGGRMAIISYHSLEDRLTKQFFKTGNLKGEDQRDFFGRSLCPWKLVTKKAVVPSAQEERENPRSRSAKLRAAEKIEL
ncbi:MAG: 16S rRNA (cytosine(1402)-N(4))-methyltransferase RsmH [Bacteroidetes bacterium]|nr:16S rRNA (cytosine(1402)-N(4))-methyltransferase RsmH [Bacteroidota bacterium]MBP6721431.1 16S rRNA (cytosine(1402)-N(4))-methyltransferase RsmH [Bacteroidia bacterium]MBP8073345.1 16S rRNA (cytosine(1402)-N(4))-methyltransferase RsmH [Bacteroidia bacterium]